MALHNESLNEFNLTSAVQKIIDRILFLRICEDKEIEKNNTLKEIAESKTDIYKKLKMHKVDEVKKTVYWDSRKAAGGI